MEADRMASLGATMTAEKLQAQRLIVLNERRQSYENRPYGMASLAAVEQFYPAAHPYSWTPIGSAKDLEAATLADVKKFFSAWYVPNNATLAVTGDFDEQALLALAEKYFGFIPKKALPERHPGAPFTPTTEKRVALTDKVELPKLLLVYASPVGGTAGDANCDLLASILARGKASRLYQRLVQKDQLATQVGAHQESLDLQGAFQIDALARPGHTTGELQEVIDEEVNRLISEGPTAAEVESSRLRIVADFARGMEGLQARSEMLAGFQVRYGDANSLAKDLARYADATPASVQAMARQVLGAPRLVIDVQPEGKQSAGGAR
jgi:predicted Zn-dependent peptidase